MHEDTCIFYKCNMYFEMFAQLQTLTDLHFTKYKRNMFWPSSFVMQKRNIFTCVVYTNRTLHVFTTNIYPILSVSKVKYFIFMPIAD